LTWKIITSVVDIVIITVILYYLLHIISGTRAVQLIKGLVLIFVASVASQILSLHTVNWFLQSILTIVLVALPIVFQPELRRALEQIGRGGFLKEQLWQNWGPREINEVVAAVTAMATEKTGALIVLTRSVGLKNYIETGVKMNARISKPVLLNIFYHGAPLHDGAVIIEDGEIAAAGCFLSLSTRADLNSKLGTRHRAAIGVSEESDALAIVVSEETGVISLAKSGELSRYLDEAELREILFNNFDVNKEKSFIRRNS